MFACGSEKKQSDEPRASAEKKPDAASRTQTYTVSVVREFPHDRSAYTQGLEIHSGKLYESTGQVGFSSIRLVDLESGKVLKKTKVAAPHFAEGITIFKNKIYQLTWQSKVGFIYDLESLKQTSQWEYSGEGWGITNDGNHLIMSDGTNMLRFIDPANMQTVRTLAVMADNGKPVPQLNELEFIEGEIWANVWMADVVVRIDPSTGHLKGVIDCSPLRRIVEKDQNAEVLNGIAYDKENKKIYLTGKDWGSLFEVKIINK